MKKWIEWVVRNNVLVLGVTVAVTLFFTFQIKNLSVITDNDDTLPQSHQFIQTSRLVEKTFGNKFMVVIGITAKQGDIFQTALLEKVDRLTRKLEDVEGVVKNSITSLSAKKVKSIQGNAEGMVVEKVLKTIPVNPEEMQALKRRVVEDPKFKNVLVSEDLQTTQIIAEFKKVPRGMLKIDRDLRAIVDTERDESVAIWIGGLPIFMAQLEKFSARMGLLFPLAVLIIGLIHFEAFRTLQSLFLPLVTAICAVLWAVGGLALLKQPMDIFNSATPILVLAIAAGHAVQILKRYYEELAICHTESPQLSPKQLSKLAVIRSIEKVGPVMIIACTIAALGFFSLVIFEIKTIQTFGVFTGCGILSALILELSLIPALRSVLPAPGEKELQRERQKSIWDRLISFFFGLAIYRRRLIYFWTGALVMVFSIGAYFLRVENSQKSYFSENLETMKDNKRLNDLMAGTNAVYTLVETPNEDDIKDPKVLKAIEKTQEFIEAQPYVGKSVSLVPFLKQMNRAMHDGNPEFYSIPESKELAAQYLFLYSNSGDPGDFDSYVDTFYQRALIQSFLKKDRSIEVTDFINKLKDFTAKEFGPEIKIRIGGGVAGSVALNEVMIKEKLLNILQIMAAVFLVSALVFRSLLAGTLILVPLISAVIVNFGAMGLLGIPLQIATALVSAMAVGIGADYGIYMIFRLREELRKSQPEHLAIEKAYKSAGKATLFVSSAVAGGFGVLMFSFGFMAHIWLGFLISLAMVVSSLAAPTVFPALILSLRPEFVFGSKKNDLRM